MKIFSWMQSKLNAKQVTKKPNAVAANNHMVQATSKEEFSDWPQSLLAIGTFGLSNLKVESQAPMPEEDGELQEEANSYLEAVEESESDCEEVDIRLQRSLSGMFCRGKDILIDQKNNVMRKKSLTFLLKKIFTTKSSGYRFNHVRDSLANPTTDKSRMEKVLRAILNKKIHPQSSTAKSMPMPNKYLGADEDEDDDEEINEGSTWVKTDSEYIVLEI